MFTVLLLTTSKGRAFKVVVIFMGQKRCDTDVFYILTFNFFQLFLILSVKSQSKSPLALALLNLFTYLNPTMSCYRDNELQVLELLPVAMVSDHWNQ